MFSKALVSPKPGERWLLVTSAYHMPRSIGIFRKAGFAVQPYPVDWRMGGRADLLTFSVFALDGLGRVDTAVREWMGLAAYWITGKTDAFFPASEPAIDSGGGRSRRIIRLGSSSRAALGLPVRESSHAASSTAAGNLRFAGHGGRPQQPAAPEDHGDRHENVAFAQRHGGDPEFRRPSAVHTTDQIVSMASRLGWTVGITADVLVGGQCRAVIGPAPQDDKWLPVENYVGVWHGTAEDAAKTAAGARCRAAWSL